MWEADNTLPDIRVHMQCYLETCDCTSHAHLIAVLQSASGGIVRVHFQYTTGGTFGEHRQVMQPGIVGLGIASTDE